VITRGEQMLALRKRRMAAAHPFFRGGFRPFFFAAAAWGFIALALWLCALAGELTLPSRFEGVAWHRHEMLFGFVGAAISGFVLTAIPNWTGRLPIAGPPLMALFGLWVAGRVAVLFSALIGVGPAAVVDTGFYVVLGLLAAREVLASKNRNMPVVGVVLLFGIADGADHVDAAGFLGGSGLGWRGAIALVVLLISLIGGRIIPSFTRNWMAKQGMKRGLPTQPQSLDMLVIAGTALALLFWLVFPDKPLTGFMLIAAAALQFLRLSRWSGWRAASDPLVLILHVGYCWLPIGLLLLGLPIAGMDVVRSAGIHALTAGAMTTMILAVMTRATLGHTGRELRASPVTVALYICVTLGAALRVVASLGVGSFMPLVDVAGLLWAAALILFLIGYGPMLWRVRPGEKS
jgi:uncharacterized protein involved in response to NO